MSDQENYTRAPSKNYFSRHQNFLQNSKAPMEPDNTGTYNLLVESPTRLYGHEGKLNTYVLFEIHDAWYFSTHRKGYTHRPMALFSYKGRRIGA